MSTTTLFAERDISAERTGDFGQTKESPEPTRAGLKRYFLDLQPGNRLIHIGTLTLQLKPLPPVTHGSLEDGLLGEA